MALVLCAAITAMCVGSGGPRGCAVIERDLGYYRGPNGQVHQGIDQIFWQGSVVYVRSRRIEWAAAGPDALAQFNADHPPRPRWHCGWLSKGNSDIDTVRSGGFWNRLGLYYGKSDVAFSFTDEHHRTLMIPAWLVALLLFVPSVFVLRRHWWLARHRNRAGLCPVCGYDLRASPNQCPECGATPGGAGAGVGGSAGAGAGAVR